jgi:signal transduction histidine kinase
MSTVPLPTIPEHTVRPPSLSTVPNAAKSNQWAEGAVWAAAFSTISLGFAVLLGWWMDIPRLRSVLPGFASMKPATALCFVLLGFALGFKRKDARLANSALIGDLLALAVVLLAVLTLTEYLFDWNIGLESFLVTGRSHFSPDPPGRMAHATAAEFALLGLATLTLDRWRRCSHVLLVAGMCLALVALVSYIYRVGPLYGLAYFKSVAIHTVAGFLALIAGLLAVRPDRGLARMLLMPDTLAITARLLIIGSFVVPILVGALILRGELLGWYDTRFSHALLVVLLVVVQVGLVWRSISLLAASDERRRRAETRERNRSLTLEALTVGAPLSLILEMICRSVEEENPGALCSILLLDEEGTHLLLGAGPSLPDSYNQAINGTKISATAGSCGTAAFTKRLIITEDILTDPNWDSYRDLAQSADLRSCWSQPILAADGSVLGTFAIYHRAPEHPTSEDLQSIRSVADLARLAIERKLTDEELDKHRAHLEDLVQQRTSELSVARDQAQAADRSKSAFLATMSHELRTPLNAIIGFTSIILQGLVGPLNDEQIKQLKMVKNSADHLLAMIQDLLDISKIEAGRMVIAKEPIDLSASIASAVGSVTPLAQKKGLKLSVYIQPNLNTLVSDHLRVQQILINLLNNAVKFTERGGVTLTVESAPVKDQEILSPAVCFQVQDTGIGIRPEEMNELFKPFRQVDASLDRRHEGTGLGLAISMRLANLLGGNISVESEFGKGSVFTFTLPLNRG